MATGSPSSADLPGYVTRTVVYKTIKDVEVKLDVTYPQEHQSDDKPRNVLLHYHGGFLIIGDRNTFYPYWLVNACAVRGWIFVTPDYRLLPESTAHDSVADANDAYSWVLDTLPSELGCKIGKVFMAGSSAGAYLALTVAASTQSRQPLALLLVYGMLDATLPRYTTRGENIFNRPAIDTADILTKYPKHAEGDTRPLVTAHSPGEPSVDPRLGLIAALHIDALFLDYMTGVAGLGQAVSDRGVDAIPEEHRKLFAVAFADLSRLPATFLLHGRDDSAVPVENSLRAADKLKAAGVKVILEAPEHAEHGFDARVGNANVRKDDSNDSDGSDSLRKAIAFFADSASQE